MFLGAAYKVIIWRRVRVILWQPWYTHDKGAEVGREAESYRLPPGLLLGVLSCYPLERRFARTTFDDYAGREQPGGQIRAGHFCSRFIPIAPHGDFLYDWCFLFICGMQ